MKGNGQGYNTVMTKTDFDFGAVLDAVMLMICGLLITL